ncbi:MAG: serine/threonine protein kinase, partial [Aquincola sp.]|nr:serine/threonine protein kinase [Aquincola sp.]
MSEAAAPTPEGQSAPPLSSKGEGGDAVVALAAGTRVAEFEIRRVLGSGGFGIVYLAWDHALEREVALKEYMPGTL